MIVDVILAVAVVATAPGAVAEFQLGVTDIRPPADGALVGVGSLYGGVAGLVGTGVKMDHLGFFLHWGLFTQQSGGVGPPGHGDHVQHILAEKQEVVGKGDDGEQVVGKGVGDEAHQHHHQINQGKNPALDGDDEEQQKGSVGEQSGVSQEQAHVQIGHIRRAAENHAVNIHHHHAGQIVQVKPQGTPDVFHGPAKRIIAEQHHGGEQQVACAVGQRVGDQPPDLPVENCRPVKAQQVVQEGVSCDLAHDVHHGGAQDDVEHQVGDAFIPVLIAVKLKLSAKVFHAVTSNCSVGSFYQQKYQKSISDL